MMGMFLSLKICASGRFGIAIGSPLSPVMAEILMHHF